MSYIDASFDTNPTGSCSSSSSSLTATVDQTPAPARHSLAGPGSLAINIPLVSRLAAGNESDDDLEGDELVVRSLERLKEGDPEIFLKIPTPPRRRIALERIDRRNSIPMQSTAKVNGRKQG